MIELVGMSLSDVLPNGSLLRLTITNDTGALNTVVGWIGLSVFPDGARIIFDSLYSKSQVIPTTQLVVTSDSKSAVIDALSNQQWLVSDLVNAFESLGNTSARVSKAELLTGSDKAESSSADGAAQRMAEQTDTDRSLADNSLLRKVEDGTTGGVSSLISFLKYGAIAVIVLGLVYLAVEFVPRPRK